MTMLPGVEVKPLKVLHDERGWLCEVLKGSFLGRRDFGQFLVTTAHPGVSKGNHYHLQRYEWFCVIKGQASLVLADEKSGVREEILLGEGNMVAVRVPPQVAHGIKNIGDEMMYLLVYTDEEFDASNPDTYARQVVA